MTAFGMQYESPFPDAYPPVQQHDKGTQIQLFHNCDKCHSSFTSKSALRHHETVHNTVYECIWPECSNRFTSRADFKKHMDAHSSEKFFPCAYCTKSFDNRERYQRHLREHVEKPLTACTRCPAKFDQKATLRRHEKEHNKVRIVPVHNYQPYMSAVMNSKVIKIGKTVASSLKNLKRILEPHSTIEPSTKRKRPFSAVESDGSNQSESNSSTESESESHTTSDNDSEDAGVHLEHSAGLGARRPVKKSVQFAPGTKGEETTPGGAKKTESMSTQSPSRKSVTAKASKRKKQSILKRSPIQPSMRGRPPRGGAPSTSRSACTLRKRTTKKVANRELYFTRSIKKFQDEVGVSLEEQFADKDEVEVCADSNSTSPQTPVVKLVRTKRVTRKFFKCQCCLYSSDNLNQFARHGIIHLKQRKGSHICTVCEAKFVNKASLQTHLNFCH